MTDCRATPRVATLRLDAARVARSEQATDPNAARRLWERAERETVDQALWVSLVSPKIINIVAKRFGNYQYNPMWQMLIDQLGSGDTPVCVRRRAVAGPILRRY